MESQGIPQLARHTFITDGGMETTLLCAHPTHLAGALDDDGPWLERVRGLRANASARSHADLDAADELDEGDPDDLARRYLELSRKLPNLTRRLLWNRPPKRRRYLCGMERVRRDVARRELTTVLFFAG
jgi:hypothetical protein